MGGKEGLGCRGLGGRERERGVGRERERFVIDSNSTQLGVQSWRVVSSMYGIDRHELARRNMPSVGMTDDRGWYRQAIFGKSPYAAESNSFRVKKRERLAVGSVTRGRYLGNAGKPME